MLGSTHVPWDPFLGWPAVPFAQGEGASQDVGLFILNRNRSWQIGMNWSPYLYHFTHTASVYAFTPKFNHPCQLVGGLLQAANISTTAPPESQKWLSLYTSLGWPLTNDWGIRELWFCSVFDPDKDDAELWLTLYPELLAELGQTYALGDCAWCHIFALLSSFCCPTSPCYF